MLGLGAFDPDAAATVPEPPADRAATMNDDDDIAPPDLLQLDTAATVECPYCGEPNWLEIDPATAGVMVQDCEVCCQPWQLTISRDDCGRLVVEAVIV